MKCVENAKNTNNMFMTVSVVSQTDSYHYGISVPTLCSLVRHLNAINFQFL